MAEASIQINQLSSNAHSAQKTCLNSSSGSHDTSANFDKILQSINAPTGTSTKVNHNEDNSQLVIDRGGDCNNNIQNDNSNHSSASINDIEIEEYLQITPRQLSVDTRVKTDLSLLTLAENATINNASSAQDTYKSPELDFFCPTVQLSYGDHGGNEKSNNGNNKLPQLQIEDTEFTGGDVRFIKIGQNIELNFPKIQLNYSEYETYSQNQPEACDSLPFVSSGVDTKEVRSFDFVDVNFKLSNQGKERNIIVNSDKISTFELLKKHSDEFLSSIKSSDSENDITTNLSFNYKDLSQNGDGGDDQLQKGRISVEGKNNALLNGITEHRMSLVFIPDIDKKVDVCV